MTFTFKNLKTLTSLMLAGVLATAGVSAMAQSPAPVAAPATTMQQAEPGAGHHKMGQRDPAKMQAWMAKRQAEMKTRLKITAPQEGAWNTFTAAMQLAARRYPADGLFLRGAAFFKRHGLQTRLQLGHIHRPGRAHAVHHQVLKHIGSLVDRRRQ